MNRLHLRLNGQDVQVEADADTPLLWVLRDQFGLVGAKFGCGIGQCGACTVHLDGVPVRSCSVPISAVGRAEVTTIEGLDPQGAHPLQQSWRELDVPQCGYCQAGQIMAAAALLKRAPRPSEQEIHEALSGHLCRCGTYLRIRVAVKRGAEIALVKNGSS